MPRENRLAGQRRRITGPGAQCGFTARAGRAARVCRLPVGERRWLMQRRDGPEGLLDAGLTGRA
ncbi:MAG: hypothetical protein M3Y90_15460, partial [Actinomycetota bacterium]|nr:hypothetical protein [Actinomycetota bacterium]